MMSNLNRKIRSKKLSTRVDLTAMVSISFLLIVFFMVTIELSKPKGIDLSLLDKSPREDYIICHFGVDNDRVITVLLDENDRMIMYSGLLGYSDQNPKEIKYCKEGIRTELYNKNKDISEYSSKLGKPKNGAIVIIKPSKKCNFKNLVDILDEMAIARIETYAIVNEFSPEETKLLASK